jgi:hypothetical protein
MIPARGWIASQGKTWEDEVGPRDVSPGTYGICLCHAPHGLLRCQVRVQSRLTTELVARWPRSGSAATVTLLVDGQPATPVCDPLLPSSCSQDALLASCDGGSKKP